jgi:hypothetical protein
MSRHEAAGAPQSARRPLHMKPLPSQTGRLLYVAQRPTATIRSSPPGGLSDLRPDHLVPPGRSLAVAIACSYNRAIIRARPSCAVASSRCVGMGGGSLIRGDAKKSNDETRQRSAPTGGLWSACCRLPVSRRGCRRKLGPRLEAATQNRPAGRQDKRIGACPLLDPSHNTDHYNHGT